MLELYQLEECPYCRTVRKRLSDWNIDYILRNVPAEKSKRTHLRRLSGQNEVPTLIDSDREVIITGEEKIILQHVEQYYVHPSSKTDTEIPCSY